MNVRFAFLACAAVVAYAPSLVAQPIVDDGVYATVTTPTQNGELTIVREQSFGATAPDITGTAVILGASAATDGRYSQSIFFRSGPVIDNTRDPVTSGEIHFPAGVTVVGIVRSDLPLDATDQTWGVWDGTGTNFYAAASRGTETTDPFALHIAGDGHYYITFTTNLDNAAHTDDFRVLVDYGDSFPAGLALTVKIDTGDDVNIGDSDGGHTIPPGSSPMVEVMVPLTAGGCAGCLIGGTCYASGDLDPSNDCLACSPSVDATGFSPLGAGSACDDGLFCTTGDVCDGAGACGGTARVCPDDANACTTAVCDEAADACRVDNVSSGTACPGGTCDGSGACVECQNDGECAGAEVCDTSVNTCQVCAVSSAMSIDPGCDATAPACSLTPGGRECVACTTDSHCATGVCDTTTNECTTCLADGSGCSAPTPVCLDPDTAPTCVECDADADCASGTCQADNTCAGCSDDNDCAGDAVCDAGTNACVACRTSGDAIDEGCSADAPICVGSAGAQACVECSADSDCDSGVCDTATNSCVACVGGSNHGCDATAPICDTTNTDNVCVMCVDDATGNDTDTGCDTDSPFCRDTVDPVTCVACINDSDCGTGELCSPDGSCASACVDSDDCTDDAAPVCEPTSGLCVECGEDADCEDGVCSENACVECASDDDCTDDNVCTNNTCVAPPVGCTADTDCADGESCVDNACQPAETPECTADTDCADGESCVDNACESAGETPECTSNAHCGNGEVCENNSCVEDDTTTTPDTDSGHKLAGGGCSTANSPSTALLGLIGFALLAIRRRR